MPRSSLRCCRRPAAAQTRDVAGAKDYAGIGRFKGSVVTGFDVKNFDAVRIQGAPFRDGKPTDARRLEGRVTRIAYRTGKGPSIIEVARNFENQLAKAGFEPLLACETDACGGIPFVEAVDTLPIPQMWIDGFNYRYYAGRKAQDGRETYVSVLVSINNDDIYTQLVAVELGALEHKMVDAAAMAKGLGENGRIALYGIYFDTDKAVVKPESRPTLDEIAKLLGEPAEAQRLHRRPHRQPGHATTTTCRSRAGAPRRWRPSWSDLQIAKSRLCPAGLGFLAPVRSNATEDGRALNRRVELVAP